MTDPWYTTFFGEDYARFDSHRHTRREVAFLADVFEPGGRILDVACGAGRHTAPLAKRGFDVFGFDLSPTLLRRAARRAGPHRLVQGTMAAFPFADESFDGIISIFNSIGYFEDESDNFAVFEGMSNLLTPGGRIVIETTNRDFFIRHAPPQSWYEEGGLVVLEARTLDPVTSRSEVDVIVIDGAERRAYHHSIRLYTAPELAMLLAAAGIEVLEVFGGFDGYPVSHDAPQLVFVGERM